MRCTLHAGRGTARLVAAQPLRLVVGRARTALAVAAAAQWTALRLDQLRARGPAVAAIAQARVAHAHAVAGAAQRTGLRRGIEALARDSVPPHVAAAAVAATH